MNAQAERSIAEVVHGVVGNLEGLVRAEIKLAKAEARDDVQQVMRAAKGRIVAGVLGAYSVGFILLGAVYYLGTLVTPWLAALLVGGGTAVMAGVVMASARMGRGGLPVPSVPMLHPHLDSRKESV